MDLNSMLMMERSSESHDPGFLMKPHDPGQISNQERGYLFREVEPFTRYLMKVQCRYCSTEVYPHEDDASEAVKHWMEYEDVRTIDDLRARMDRTCDGCRHMMDCGGELRR
jgi:hypothetical protein